MSGIKPRRHARILGNPLVGILGNPPILSAEVETVIYRHAADGKTYGHEFGKNVQAHLNKNGTVTLRHAKGKPLWEPFGDKPFLVNPPGGKKAKRAKRKRRSAPHRKAKARRQKRAAHRQRAMEAQTDMARRKRSRSRKGRRRNSRAVVVHRTVARRSGRRRIHRNPPFSFRGLTDLAIGGAVDGVKNVAGSLSGRLVCDFTGIDKASMMGLGVRALTGFGLGLATEMLLGRGQGRAVLSGALADIAVAQLKDASIPYVSSAFADWSISAMPSAFAAYPRRQALPAGNRGMSAYPQRYGEPANPWAIYAQ